MAIFLKNGSRSSYFCPVTRAHIQGNVVEVKALSSGLRAALNAGWIKTATKEEYEGYLKSQGESSNDTPKVSTDRKSILMAMTKDQILEEYKWMDPEDLAEAKKQKKKDMINFLLKIEPDYE